MSRKSEWIHRIPAALRELEASSLPWIDRSALAQLLGVSDRNAHRLMVRLGAIRAGLGYLIERRVLIDRLQRVTGEPDAVFEQRRMSRLDAELLRTRRELSARRVEIPVEVPSLPLVRDLPATVRLERGRLEIRFVDSGDLLRQLYLLGQAIAEDYAHFAALTEEQQNG